MGRLAALALLPALGAGPGASAQVPPAVDDRLGSYRVISANGAPLCTVRLVWEPTVGGEIDTATCEKTLPLLAEALRFFAEGDGDLRLEDALHRPVGRISEDEAGLSLHLGSGANYGMEPLIPPRELMPTERATGRWRVTPGHGTALTPDCRLRLHPGGAVEVARACPSYWRRFAGARWSTTSHWLTLRMGTAHLAFDWTGGDGTDVTTADRKWTLYFIDR